MEGIKLISIEFAVLVIVQFISYSLELGQKNVTNSDQLALLSIKAHVTDPANILTNNWTTSTPVCNWFGVTCSTRHRRVAILDLNGLGLVGTIPSHIGNLSFLVGLNFTNNSLHGDLPKELGRLRRLRYIDLAYNLFIGDLPGWFGSLAKLQVIRLKNNKFSGSLPTELSNLTMLEVLNLGTNLLTGNVPEQWGIGFVKLNFLSLQNNNFTGQFPLAILNMSSLEVLSLTNNSLSGPFPTDICRSLSKLNSLYLSFNHLDGRIPSSIKLCSKLQELSISYNSLRGPIPREIGNLTTLRKLYLGYDHLEGQLVEEVGNLHLLTELSISNTNLYGPIPEALGKLQRLEVLVLQHNNLTGTIPPSIFNISTLRELSFETNQLSGPLPTNMGNNMNNLQNIFLMNNSLNGIIPASLSNASNLQRMNFALNYFSGHIPESLGDLEFLESINLAQNNLSIQPSFFSSVAKCKFLQNIWLEINPLNVTLPESIGHLSNTSLQSLLLSESEIKGRIPKEISKLSGLIDLDLSGNYLRGEIPSTVGNLFNLQRMYAFDNQLEGLIPSEFCNLGYLGTLYLSNNQISGALPACLGNVTSLRYLLLDSNNLTSEIPKLLWSLHDLLYLNISYNFLHGIIPSDIANMKQLTLLDFTNNNFSGEIPSSIGSSLENLQMLYLGENKFEGLIPESLGKLIGLEDLDLSYNDLTGVIPKSLEALSHLKFFNVSFNRLSGEVPHQGRFENFKNDSFFGNKDLCGGPLFEACRESHHHGSRKNKVLRIVLGSIAIASLVFLLMIVFYVKRIRVRKSSHQIDVEVPKMHERVSYYDLQRVTNGFSENNLLGSGSFGSVYKGELLDGTFWAIKVFNMQHEDAFKSFDRECEILRSLRHRNLTQVITSCSSPDFKAIVLDYMPNGSLETWLHSSAQILDLLMRLEIMIDVACALEYLHHGYTSLVVHCDLKPSNILLNDNMVGHVSDFGISKLFNDEESFVLTNTLATLGYMAPEYGLDGRVSSHGDVYSYGIVLMETFTGRRPSDSMFVGDNTLTRWVEESIQNSVRHIVDPTLLKLEGDGLAKEEKCLSSILKLAVNCTKASPQQRCNIKDVVASMRKIRLAFIATT